MQVMAKPWQEAVRALTSLVDRELWVVTARAGPRRGGLIATFVNQASIVPEAPRVLVGLAWQHHTEVLVAASGAFGLHLVDEGHLDWVWHFGLETGWKRDKLAGLKHRSGITGSPLLTDARGWLECRVEARLETGDRTVYLAEVVDAGGTPPFPVLTLKRLLQLAPAEKLQQLKEFMERDATMDALAIECWRKQRAGTQGPEAP